jgi:selenide,water dikinase
MIAAGAHACTDISGFGLAGHALEMAEASGVGLEIWLDAVPCFDEALTMAGSGVVTGLTAANRAATAGRTTRGSQALPKEDLLYDPQTSGGLLAAVAASHAQRLLDGLAAAGVEAATVGRVIAAAEAVLVIAKAPADYKGVT